MSNNPKVIEFKMALEKEPGIEKVFLYKAFLNAPRKEGESPMFYVTEKGKQDIQFTVKPGSQTEDTQFIMGERSDFSRGDIQKAAELIQYEIAKRLAAVNPNQKPH